jgi:DNA-3-methyladenine glycosylase I
MKQGQKLLQRCAWVSSDPLYRDYHDNEWGVPLFDERALFELFNLEGMQAGLSWITILKKRDNYRRLFDGFDPHKIVHYDEKKIDSLMADAGIIRHRLKIMAIIQNAKAFLALKEQGIDFSEYIWQFVDGKPIKWTRSLDEAIPTFTDVSEALSRDLKKRGFKFVGRTICYAFMQAAGLVNDHSPDCFMAKAYARK